MKFFLAAIIIFLAVGLSPARAQNADDQYLGIYGLMQQADALAGSNEPRQALTQYTEAQSELQKFQTVFPDWNPKIVNFRLKYLADKIAAVTTQLPATAPTNSISVSTNEAPTIFSASTSHSDAEVLYLRGRVQELQADNAALTAKLKEALAVQPSSADPRELAKAQEQIQSLMKENDLLKANMARTNTMLDTNALVEVQTALAEAKNKLDEQTARADKLAAENAALLASPGALAALRDENALLKKQIAGLQSAAARNLPTMDRLNSDLKEARLEVAALQSDAQVNQLEKLALEDRLKKLKAVQVTPWSQEVNDKRIRELTQERDDLLAKLGEANKQLYGRNKQNTAARINELSDEVQTLRARLAVDESQAVPYSAEELAMFKQSPAPLANPNAEKKSIKELPAGSAELVAEAQAYFSAKQYDKAAEDYQKILQRDENNPLVLGNLAAIEMEQGKLDDAEKHINAAIAQNPDDAYNLSTLGTLKFRQEKYDEAFDALSRAEKLDPQNPQIENYLGITLSHKGLRVQAETALRKAIQLDPNYADAHNNLAVIYLNEQPPLVQLARWHYQKALDAGLPHNLELEKALGMAGAPQ